MLPSWRISEGEEFKVIWCIWECGLHCIGQYEPPSEEFGPQDALHIRCAKPGLVGEIWVFISRQPMHPGFGLLVELHPFLVNSPQNYCEEMKSLTQIFNESLKTN
jgi:hypothetical protein